MKHLSLDSHLLFSIALFTVFGFLTACNRGPSEFDLRVLQHLQSHNRRDANEFKVAIAREWKKIEEQTRSGITKYASYIPIYQQLIFDHDRNLSCFKRLKSAEDGSILQTLEEKALIDSISLALDDWQLVRERFCASFQNSLAQPIGACQSKPILESSNLNQRFSNSNKENWPTELELIQAHITEEALEMVERLSQVSNRTICWPMDSLVLLNYNNGNIVEAGEEALVGLQVTLHVASIKPEFFGSGRIEINQGGSTATLHIKTSEDMIPQGRNEAEIPYTSKALIPKADGTIIELHNNGKIKLRRPCKSQ